MRVIIVIILNVCIVCVNTKYVLGIQLPLTTLIDNYKKNIPNMLSILTDRVNTTFIYYYNYYSDDEIDYHHFNYILYDYAFHVVLNDIFTFEFVMIIQTREIDVFQDLINFTMVLNNGSLRSDCQTKCHGTLPLHNKKKKRVVIRRKGQFNGKKTNIPMGITKYFTFYFSTKGTIKIEEIRVTIIYIYKYIYIYVYKL